MNLEIPKALRLREEAICTALREAVATGGETGAAAEMLEAILLPHLAKERVEVLQPLGLLPRLARGEVSADMTEVLPQIDQLKNDLHDLRVEHATILSAIKRLVAAARAEGKSQHARFAERLLFRAWLDESVFTPLAILMGEYLELRLKRKSHPAPATPPSTPRAPAKLKLPEALHLSHAQLSVALTKVSHAGGRTTAVAEDIAQILEPHFEREEAKVLRILGLLAPLAAGQFDPEWMEDDSEWEKLETNESVLNLEHRELVAAGEELLAIAREEDAPEVLDFAERLLLRIRLDEEVFYRAALLIRNYLRLRARKETLERNLI
ncbi:MAG TPA: hypothetical protein VFV83_06465 [Chthoniobacteraceae bacterium]|nr:hypothetical protein [Chthoniobacteraceae bacterium]